MTTYITPDFSDKKTLEKYSSAYTLSDMEIFIFPELFYPLVIADIMSPVLWRWRDDPWFRDIRKKNFISKSNRIKPVSYTHLRAHETDSYLVCRLLLEKKKKKKKYKK